METDKDQIYTDVANHVIGLAMVSKSILQTKFKIGYKRADRLMECLINNGIISHKPNFLGQHIVIRSVI